MRKLYDRLLKALNISGRDWAVLLLALLLAFSIWLIHNLSLKYNDFLSVPVEAQCNLTGRSDKSIDRSDIVARCRVTGYRAITSHIVSRPVTVNFAPSVMKHKDGDVFYVLASDLKEYTHLIYGEGVTLEYFVSDTVFFRFPAVNSKKVPVHPVATISYAEQHTSRAGLKVMPDSVTVYGEKQRLETIDKVVTKPIRHSSLSSSVNGVVGIEKIRNVRISDSEVQYALDVTRYIEVSKTLTIKTVNVPSDKILQVLPSTVKVYARFAFPVVGDEHSNLEVEVDYNEFLRSLSGKCPVQVSGNPKGLIAYEADPVAVSCVLEDK